jgi:hypothetical protein
MRLRGRCGSAVIEGASWILILTLILVGMANIGRYIYTYFTLRKMVYSVAQYISSRQQADFCDSTNTAVAEGIAFGITGTLDSGAASIVTNLTPDLIQVTPESWDSATQTLTPWDSSTCVAGVGGRSPQFIDVSIPNGYALPINILYVPFTTVFLKPHAKVPYGG